MNASNEATTVYSPSFVSESFAYNKEDLLCKYYDGDMHEEIKQIYKIGILLNKDNTWELKTVDALQFIIQLINLNGGINDRRITSVTIGWKTDDNFVDFRNKVSEILDDEELLYLVGTTDENERAVIADLLVEKDKLLFSIFISGGETEYENIIQINAISNQLFTLTFHYFLQSTDCYAIVYDKDRMYIIIIMYYLF